MENQFKNKFDTYAIAGETIEYERDGFKVVARIEHDEDAGRPDERDEGFWPSRDPEAAGYCPPEYFDKSQAHAKEVMQAWKDDEWFYCGIVLSVSYNGVELDSHAASLWGIHCNYPKDETRPDHEPNDYLTEVANELLDEALSEGERLRKVMMDKLSA